MEGIPWRLKLQGLVACLYWQARMELAHRRCRKAYAASGAGYTEKRRA